MDDLKIDAIYFTYSHFVNIKDFFEKFEDYLKSQVDLLNIEQDFKDRMIEVITINKICDLQEILTDFQWFENYIIIDGLTDIQSFLTFKKYFLKIFALCENLSKRIKIVLISNFDILHSEFSRWADLSTFIPVCFPNVKRDFKTLKEIVSKNINLEKYQFDVDEVINKSLLNLTNSITNLNEIIYCVSENLEEYSSHAVRIDKDHYLRNYYNDLVTCFNHIEIKNNVSEEENFQNEKKIKNTSIKAYDNQTVKKIKLNDKLHQQIFVTPIHFKNLDSQMDSNVASVNRVNILETTKNLTDSLSKCQKILLLSAFMAGEISPKMDGVIFKTVKKTKLRIRRFDTHSLKTKLSHTFNIHRLLAIYSSLKSIIDRNESSGGASDTSIELIADINSIIHLNLIRYVNLNDFNFMARKMSSNISLDFAKKIAEDYEIKLDDFLSHASFDTR